MLTRLLKHLSSPGWWARRAFRADDLAAIGAAVKASETKQRGEIRIAIEGTLPLRALLDNQSPRERAATLFQTLGVAATREANGILVYIQLVDRQVEILADHGIAAHVPAAEWETICHQLEAAFAKKDYRPGTLAAIDRITTLLAQHFPASGDNPNELDDAPTVL
jgi:uncharacterized membrane protein